ncbi:AI-2E family transporter [Geodermatophilus sabuli]|uniref:Predicted PurR-regulated permease PerM n=1 Tax=Geodermatophilus sabuli TaxID=1564158 RepID=A0A285ECU3_9ACTN|nr:AI-2E family transporter [Geodermatophilus sabuli]MBB3085685.1 putative PurR-regulated permease PerM [Geodermatophilus sabuli]SNX95896.1 Predicted PurR-regulated permease PerM [Geodermatophilus sabuli]
MRLRSFGRPAAHPEAGATSSDRSDRADRSDRDGTPAAVTSAPAPVEGRGPRLQHALRALAVFSAQLLLIVAALVVVGYVLGRLWVILLPIVLGLLFATVLWPPTRFLRQHGWPPALAAALVTVGALALFGGIIAAIAPSVADQVGELADQASGGLQELQGWLTGPPFNLGEDQIGQAVDQAINSIQSNAQNIAGYALTGASAIGNGLINLVLALLLAFFFVKDGPRWVPWLSAQTGSRAAPHVAALSHKTWSTLSDFIRQQALVGFVDAFFIGLGLWILDVPLVLPLSVLTFFGAFIPIIGAFVAGAFAVLIALVSNGWTTALIVLAIVLVVQQLEGNVLQPIIQGRGFNLHAAVVILAVTAGGSLAGITGAFLGVPVAALIAVIYRYVRDELDGRSPEVADDGTRPQVTGDEQGAALTREPAPADGGPEHPRG